MHIQTVTFTMPIENKAMFEQKIAKDNKDSEKSGCLSREVWLNETKKNRIYNCF